MTEVLIREDRNKVLHFIFSWQEGVTFVRVTDAVCTKLN